MLETNDYFQIAERNRNTTNKKCDLIANEIFSHPNFCQKGIA